MELNVYQVRLEKYQVPAPRGRRLKDIRKWLLENVGKPDEDWSISVDIEVVEFFGRKLTPNEPDRLTEMFNVGFRNEEDKVKFILSFL